MMGRSRAREVVLQLLYQYDLNQVEESAIDAEFLANRLHHQAELVRFATNLLQGVLRNRDKLDAQLTQVSQNWSLDRMAMTDRNVLRMGAFELLYSDTPRPVVIDEAVEIGRRFGDKHSAQFINGILDGLHRPT